MPTSFEELKLLLTENHAFAWLTVTATTAVVTLVIKVVLSLAGSRLRKFSQRTESKWDDAGVELLGTLKGWVVFIWTFSILSKSLNPPEDARKILAALTVLATFVQVAVWGLYLIKTWRTIVLEPKMRSDASSAAALGLAYTMVQTVFLTILFLIGLSNLGIDITALITGLGVGGIAVALAAQNVLGDLLASLSIVLDKPFVVGDFIVAGNEKGEVEHIGIKTTRLRSLTGEQIVLSNKDILESRIQNFKRMWRRRVAITIGVTYSTPLAKLEKIPVWLKEFVTSKKELEFDRSHFATYGPSSLDFELVFFVANPDYNFFMDIKQVILLEIYKKFADEGVEFAFPSQSLYVEKLPQKTPAPPI